jgi:osmoprotectant transport system permease protein
LDFLPFVAQRWRELVGLTGQHLVLVLVSTLAAVAIGLPLGLAMTRLPRLARPLLGLAGLMQTVPSLALFGFLIPLPLIGGIGARTAIVALVLYALLPILRNTHAGIQQVDKGIVEAATGLGMTSGQRLRMVELPLALPVILAGIRIAAVVSVGTATIAAAIGAGGLGTYVFRGIATVDTRLILAGAIPAALLALAVDGLLGMVEKSRRPARAAAQLAAGVAAAVAIAVGTSGWSPRPRIVVGSKNFTEQVILGEIVAGLLEGRGYAVDRRLNLGGTALCHAAVLSGELDVYVEYTGTALTDILKRPAVSDPRAALQTVREGYRELGLSVGDGLGFNNTFALVVRREESERKGLRRISDLAAHAGDLRVGLFGEFLERSDGMAGLLRTYGFSLAVPPREMDLGLLYQALQQERVDLVVGSATDGLIAALNLVVLEDDRRYFPPYDAVPVVRTESLARNDGLAAALAWLSGRIDEAAMRRMNYAVDGEHRAPQAVAREFLESAGGARASEAPGPRS